MSNMTTEQMAEQYAVDKRNRLVHLITSGNTPLYDAETYIKQAYLAGAKEDRWVKITDESSLPENLIDCLVCDNTQYRTYTSATYSTLDEKWLSIHHMRPLMNFTATHWMPLPTPPQD